MCEIKKQLVSFFDEPGDGSHIDILISHFKKYNMNIPSDFIDFYRASNGYKIYDHNYEFSFNAPEDFISQDTIKFNRFCMVEWLIEEYERSNDDFFPKAMISFIDMPIGIIVISCREDSFGNVFYCETDLHPEQFIHPDYSDDIMPSFDYPNKPLPAAMFKVADSFTEFLNLLELTE